MAYKDNNFGGSLGLDFGKWWRHMKLKNFSIWRKCMKFLDQKKGPVRRGFLFNKGSLKASKRNHLLKTEICFKIEMLIVVS